MQLDNFSLIQGASEPHDKRLWRLKYKWMIEAEIWLITLIIIELM